MPDHILVADLIDMYEAGMKGWDPNEAETEKFVSSLPHPTVGDAMADIEADDSDYFPFLKMLEKFLSWKRGSQGIGDCVSFSYELVCFFLACEEGSPPCEFATEAIYGGSRVEARGGRLGGYSDGSYGAVASKWVRDWGILLRQDYSKETGIADHNLTAYSKAKAKDWGNFGCGGKTDERGEGKLDKVARQHPVKDVTLVKTAEDLIRVRKPTSVCSNVGYGQMVRDKDGVVRRRGSWAHAMTFAGHMKHSRYGHLVRQWQSWGESCSGPDDRMAEIIRNHFKGKQTEEVIARLIHAVSACSWWTTMEDADSQLRQGDSFAVAGIKGWGKKKPDHVLI